MKKKTGNVKPVETSTQKKGKKVVDPLTQPIVIPDKVRKMAKDMGVDVGAVTDRLTLVQNRILGIEGAINFIAEGLDARDEKLAPLVELAKRIKESQKAMPPTQPMQGTPQGGRGGIGQIIGVLRETGVLGGSSEDPLMRMFMQQVVRTGLESMSLGNVLMKSYVLKVAPAEYAEAMRSVDKTMAKATGESKNE